MDYTTRLGLPLLSPGQSQKEVTHNEALFALDAIVAGCVEEDPRVSPPTNPQPGQSYIVAHDATGNWSGMDGKILTCTPAGWREQDPVEGQLLNIRSSGNQAVFRSGEWELGVVRANRILIDGRQVLGNRSGAISEPVGGEVIDAEARACVVAILTALRAHGLVDAA